MRQLRQWSAAALVGLVATTLADIVLEILGHGPTMAGGLAVGGGVAAAALTGQWLERRHQARELLAKFNEPDPV